MSKNLGSKKIFSRILFTTRRVTLCLIQMAAVVSVSAARTVSAIAATAKLSGHPGFGRDGFLSPRGY